ncbi:MAG: ABC transporter permease [Anaerolineae bacterium]|jgi:ABC-type dipeptide/oligopeptide/nickel transport system permease component
MIQYILRRILQFIPVLLAVTVFTFTLVRIIPGGPFDRIGDKTLPPEIRANLEAKYSLDEPVWQQYLRYLWNLLHFDLGPSLKFRTQTVNDIIGRSLPVSAQLGVMSIALAVVIGIPTGVLAALYRNTGIDYGATFVAIFFRSVPNIVLGPVMILIFALQLGWVPVARWETPAHWILPTFTLGTAYAAGIARLTRGSLLEVMGEDYIRTARAKGLREMIVIGRHALKNALIPVVTYLGPILAAVVTGTFVVETIFGIPGLGRHFVESVGNRDYPLVMGTALVYALLLVSANLFVDITYAWLDPRIRYE